MDQQEAGQDQLVKFNIDDELNKPMKNLEKYDRVFNNNTEFFSTYNPDMIEEALVNYIKKENYEFKVKEGKYKIKYTVH